MKHHLKQTSLQSSKQIQKIIMSPRMQQALHLLQLPIQELATALCQELENNPLLEFFEEEVMEKPKNIPSEFLKDHKSYIENTIPYNVSFFDDLMQQAKEVFSDPRDLEAAQWIIGNLDHRGFLSSPLEEMALFKQLSLKTLKSILKKIQEFDPPGIGAHSLQDSLLIQLRRIHKVDSLAYKIVEHHYYQMLHNQIPQIARALHLSCAEIRKTIEKEIAPLNMHPGSQKYNSQCTEKTFTIIPDIKITYNNACFFIEVNEAFLSSLRFNKTYLSMLEKKDLSKEIHHYLEEKISSGKWLLKNLQERQNTLYRIAQQIVAIQKNFLIHPQGKLVPCTMKTLAENLNLHESTIVRAVANKYLSCPRGIFSLRSFFSHFYTTESGEDISVQVVKGLLKEIIAKEDPYSPFSDETISSLIKKKGIPCARRTIAKYRQEMMIGNKSQRKIYK